MNTLAAPRTRMQPVSEEEYRLIRSELTELLKTPHFSNSKRYPALLSYVVEKTLAGRSDELKERTLGIEVFHRSPDYDTNSDTVVRVAAGEVRKRLALVYHEDEGEHAIQITLPAGSYVPEFFTISGEMPAPPISVSPALDQRILHAGVEGLIPPSTSRRSRITWWKPGAALTAAAILITLFMRMQGTERPTSLDLFWQPIHASSHPAIICPGALVRAPYTSYGMALAKRTDDYPFTSMTTAVALAEFVNLFSKNHMEYVIQPASSTTLTDMKEHPVVLIGAYSNEWEERIQSDLRYRFSSSPARQIYDATNPSTMWTRPKSLPFLEEDDFAIVARFHSKLTDNLVVLIAGIGKNGTTAATQFVTSARYLDLLNQQPPKDWAAKNWATKNLEIVLKVRVVDGQTGTPSIEAVYVW